MFGEYIVVTLHHQEKELDVRLLPYIFHQKLRSLVFSVRNRNADNKQCRLFQLFFGFIVNLEGFPEW
jgi:hypothetical protein